MLWSALVTKIYALLGEASGNSRWSDATILLFAKAAEKNLVRACEGLRTTEKQNLVIGSTEALATYSMSAAGDVDRIVDVWVNGTKLECQNEAELAAIYDGEYWRDETGDPLYYIPVSTTQIRLVPGPDATATNGLVITSIRTPDNAAALSSASPSIYEDLHEDLKYDAGRQADEEDPGGNHDIKEWLYMWEKAIAKGRGTQTPKDRVFTFGEGAGKSLSDYRNRY